VTAVALAGALAKAGQTCLVVDANPVEGLKLRRAKAQGLSDILAGEAILEEIEMTDPRGFSVLSWGRQPADAINLLASDKLQSFFRASSSSFSFVIIDAPGVLMSSHVQLLAPLADVALLVLRWNETALQTAERAADLLGRANKKLYLILAQVDQSKMCRYEQAYLELNGTVV
jgi:Mrp family chromosome partitioning ATPase